MTMNTLSVLLALLCTLACVSSMITGREFVTMKEEASAVASNPTDYEYKRLSEEERRAQEPLLAALRTSLHTRFSLPGSLLPDEIDEPDALSIALELLNDQDEDLVRDAFARLASRFEMRIPLDALEHWLVHHTHPHTTPEDDYYDYVHE